VTTQIDRILKSNFLRWRHLAALKPNVQAYENKHKPKASVSTKSATVTLCMVVVVVAVFRGILLRSTIGRSAVYLVTDDDMTDRSSAVKWRVSVGRPAPRRRRTPAIAKSKSADQFTALRRPVGVPTIRTLPLIRRGDDARRAAGMVTSNKCIAVRTVAAPLLELTCHM